MDSIFNLCNKLSNQKRVKKQLILNKPFKLLVDSKEVGSYIFRASGDVYISSGGEVNSGFYEFNEQTEKIQVEVHKQIFVYDILFMNDKIIVTNSPQSNISVFTTESNIDNLESYLNGLLVSSQVKDENTVNESTTQDQEPASQVSGSKVSSKTIYLLLFLLLVIGGSVYYFFFSNPKEEIADDQDQVYKQLIFKIFDYMNTGTEDSLFQMYADTLYYYGKANILKSSAVIDHRNLTNNVIQNRKQLLDTLSVVINRNTEDSTIIVTGIVVQYSTLQKNMIPYIYNSIFEYRFNKDKKIIFINSDVTKKDIDYNTIIGVQDLDLVFNSENEAVEFLTRYISRLNDLNFTPEYHQAIVQALVKKIGGSKIVTDANNLSISYPFQIFLDSVLTKYLSFQSIAKVVLTNGMISEVSVIMNSSSSGLNISSPGYYYINATNDNYVYLYTSPSEDYQSGNYFDSKSQIYIQSINNGFGYIEINSNGKLLKGWVRLTDLVQN